MGKLDFTWTWLESSKQKARDEARNMATTWISKHNHLLGEPQLTTRLLFKFYEAKLLRFKEYPTTTWDKTKDDR